MSDRKAIFTGERKFNRAVRVALEMHRREKITLLKVRELSRLVDLQPTKLESLPGPRRCCTVAVGRNPQYICDVGAAESLAEGTVHLV